MMASRGWMLSALAALVRWPAAAHAPSPELLDTRLAWLLAVRGACLVLAAVGVLSVLVLLLGDAGA